MHTPIHRVDGMWWEYQAEPLIRYWSVRKAAEMVQVLQSFARMLVISTILGAFCGALGMYASYYANVPSGTMIVLIAAAGFLIALGIGPAMRRRETVAAGPATSSVPAVPVNPGSAIR